MPAGRPPKPTVLKALEGGRGHRTKAELSKRDREPKPSKDAPMMPSWLDASAKRKWKALIEHLNDIGVLTAVDGDVLACYCDAYSRKSRLTRFLRLHGEVEDGKPRAECALRDRADDQLKKWGAELGIGAASRTKIEVKKADDGPNPLEEIIAGNTRRR